METAYRIYDFHNEQEWLSGRMNGIGGSDASAVVGMNPYKSNIDLFEEKIGRRIPEDISDKPCVIYGKLAESPVRELFRLDYPEYQVEHHEFRILQSIQHPFMQASPAAAFLRLRQPISFSRCREKNGMTGSRTITIYRFCIICSLPGMSLSCSVLI